MTARTTHDRITHERTRALSQTAASNRRNNADIQMDESDAGTIREKGNKLVTRTLELAKSTGLVVSSMMLLKELLLPKMNVYMPNIIIYAKTLLMSLRAATRRSVEHAARLVGAYPKIASAYAMVILAASATKMINELRLLAHLIAHAGTAILGMHGIQTDSWHLTNASVDEADDASDSGPPPSPLTTSD